MPAAAAAVSPAHPGGAKARRRSRPRAEQPAVKAACGSAPHFGARSDGDADLDISDSDDQSPPHQRRKVLEEEDRDKQQTGARQLCSDSESDESGSERASSRAPPPACVSLLSSSDDEGVNAGHAIQID